MRLPGERCCGGLHPAGVPIPPHDLEETRWRAVVDVQNVAVERAYERDAVVGKVAVSCRA